MGAFCAFWEVGGCWMDTGARVGELKGGWHENEEEI